MKTVLEQLMELKGKIDAIENAICGDTSSEFEPCCSGECDCGCDEPPVEVEDDSPEYDGAGFTHADRVVDSQYMVTEDDKYVGHVHLTKVELIDFATRLTERVIASVKEAVINTGLDADDLVTLELNTWNGNAIEVELDKDTLTNNINSEIDDAICLDVDSISDEIDDIFGDMYLEKIS
jgi:hypothetical protein